jgi:hypothetical protein
MGRYNLQTSLQMFDFLVQEMWIELNFSDGFHLLAVITLREEPG